MSIRSVTHFLVAFPNLTDHFLAVVLIVVFPIRAKLFGYRRLLEATPELLPKVRRWLYKQAMFIQWGLALFLVGEWTRWRHPRPVSELGLRVEPTPEFLLALGAAAVMIAILFWQARRIARSEPALEQLGTSLGRMKLVLPHDGRERRLFLWLSLTGGICEELLYRGFLIRYFGYWMPPVAGLAISSVIFGLGHVYQGTRGVVLTGLLGAFLGTLYLVCGSLVPSMLLHAAGDMYSGWIAHAALSRESASAPLTAAACDPPPTP